MGHMIDAMKVYKSRYFRVRHKLSYERAVSHVTQHATGAEPLFIEDSDYLCMLYLIKKVCKKFKLSLLSFVLMINHLHLLLRLDAANLPQAMKELFQTYAKYFNKKYIRKGHVFCSAYRATLCSYEAHLLAASLYIHRNPVEAGLVAIPADYRWSSCRLFLNNMNKKTFVDFNFILNILDDDIVKAREHYRRLLKRVDSVRIGNLLEEPRALDKIVDILKAGNGRLLRSHDLLIDEDLEKIIERLRNKDRLRRPYDIEARRFLIVQLKARSFNMTEIAQRLELSRRSIYNALK